MMTSCIRIWFLIVLIIEQWQWNLAFAQIVTTRQTTTLSVPAASQKIFGPKKVAFYATLLKNFGPVSQNADLVFDNLVTNVGSAFDRYSGRFTAPVTATYQFSVTLGAQHGKIAAVYILKNGKLVQYVWTESTAHFSTSSSTFTLSLEAGDQIWLQVRSANSNVYGEQLTSFTGFLIFEN